MERDLIEPKAFEEGILDKYSKKYLKVLIEKVTISNILFRLAFCSAIDGKQAFCSAIDGKQANLKCNNEPRILFKIEFMQSAIQEENMDNTVQPYGPDARRSRQSIRLTFRIADGKVSLISHERLNMISPPTIGERPVAGRHSGFWMEMRNEDRQTIFHRPLLDPLGDSVEVHSPDGKIERVFGESRENIFEVLVPDDPRAKTVAIMGESLSPVKSRRETAVGSRELASFDIPRGLKGSSNGGLNESGRSEQ